jgi:hypothetical protein
MSNMKISRKTHLLILTTLLIFSAGIIPSAIVGLIVPLDVTVPWFSGPIPLNLFILTTCIFTASFFKQQIYEKLEAYIYPQDLDNL